MKRIFAVVILAAMLCGLGPLPVHASTNCTTGFCVFLPAISAPPGDLKIYTVELTQTVQNASSGVPLVANRPAVLRVYGQATGMTSSSISGVYITVTAVRHGAGTALSGSPKEYGPYTIVASPDRSVYSSTENLSLPSAWLTGAVDLTVKIDSRGGVIELDESNNSLSKQVTFNVVPDLRVRIIPITYTHVPNGVTYAAPSVDTISATIKMLYPVANVAIEWHTPLPFTGNLTTSNDFSALLDSIGNLRGSEVSSNSGIVYYGLVPDDWFSGAGIVGIGYINYRAALGLDYSGAGYTAAHEIGHTLGRYHAPSDCSLKPSGVDASYPYSNGSIGQYGVNVFANPISLVSPNNYRDIMGYCSPKWISDYTYQALYNAQRLVSSDLSAELLARTPEAVLTVQARGGADGWIISSVMEDESLPTPADSSSPYRLRLVAASGEMLAETGVTVLEIADLGEPAYRIRAALPRPAGMVVQVMLLKDNQVLAEWPMP